MIRKNFIILALIVLLGAFLRFYNLTDVSTFEFDDQYNTYLAYNLLHGKISLIGQESSFGGLFWGPWHYLYLTPFLFITNLHPIGVYIGEIILGLLTIISYYFVGLKLFSSKVGFLVAFFRSILFSAIINDRTVSPPYPAEMVALWFIYLLFLLYHGSKKTIIFLSFLAGLMTSVHAVLFPLIIVWIILMFIKKIKVNLKIILLSFFSFLLPIMPLIVFELRHNFVHVKGFLITLFNQGNTTSLGFWEKFFSVIKYNVENFYMLFDRWMLPGFLGVIILGALLLINFRNRFIFLTTFCVIIIYYSIYPRNVPEYYYMALTPIILLYVSALLINIWKNAPGKMLVLLFVGTVLYVNLSQFIYGHKNPGKFGLAQKDLAVKTIVEHQKGKGEFSVSYFVPFGRQFGFQYFFTLYGLEPRHEIKPPIYSLVMPRSFVSEQDLSFFTGDIGVIFPEDEPEQGK